MTEADNLSVTTADDIDASLRRMSQQTMDLLDSLVDEVSEMVEDEGKPSSSSDSNRKSRNRIHNSHHYDSKYDDNDNDSTTNYDEDNNTITNFRKAPTPKSGSKNGSRLSLAERLQKLDETASSTDHENDSIITPLHDDLSLDDSINKELKTLREVQRDIQKEMIGHNSTSLAEAIERLGQAPNSPEFKKIMTTADKAIIRRILDEEMKKQPKAATGLLGFLHRNHLYGPGVGQGDELNAPLLGLTIVIWCIIIYLVFAELSHEEL